MSEKKRVYELANELGMAAKDVLAILIKEGYDVKTTSSSLLKSDADLVFSQIMADNKKKEAEAQAAKARPAAPPVPAAAPAVAQEPSETTAGESGENGDEIHLKSPVTVRDLAQALDLKPNAVIVQLMGFNIFAAINQVLELDIVEKICAKNGKRFVQERREKSNHPVFERKASAVAAAEAKRQWRPQRKVGRPPVVVFMGHVDHGKTTLQDYIRKTKVAAGEAGGITQAIGASVAQYGDQTITFLDTPGHAAFTAMRARGANATDIAVLVIAATEGIMPQTVEAIHHAQAAKVPIIVAVTKIDLPGADPDKVRRQLQENGIQPEDWGGNIAVIPCSGITGEGVDDLLERILLEAEMLELAADPDAPFEGLVIEAQMESGMGPTANILVRNGTLRIGDWFSCGATYGKAKAILDTHGKRLAKATASTPVKIMGYNGVPEAGETVVWQPDEKTAKAVADEELARRRAEELAPKRAALTLEDINLLFKNEAASASLPELNLILKTDVRGSLEAIGESINAIKSQKITCKVIHSGVGEITENDVILAAASKAIIIGFHVRAMPGINKIAKNKGVEIRLYSIIYELLDDLRDAMRGRLTPETKEVLLGEAEIMQVFNITKAGKICGCRVNSGSVRVNLKAKVYRQKELIYSGLVASLKHFKEDVKEMKAGQECGIKLDNFEDFEVGDRISVFQTQQIAPEL
ncbi:MAG: translation initiation factor IF-2 [Victivallales bacterium]|nr:translation initiation factor IF-2 [Victivallales bacterium]